MADVTTTFAAKDESFAKTVGNLQSRLTEFSGGVEGFNSKVAGMASSFAKFAGPIAAVATAFFGVKAAADAFGNALAMGGRLDDLTKRTGATAGEMLLLEKAFDLAGSSAEAVGPTISKLNRFLAEASEAGSAQSKTLQNLGLTYAQLAELSPSEQMRVLAERISSIESPALKTQAAMDVFGKSGGELIPLLSDFSGELSKASGFLGSLPGIMDENAGAFADLDDNIKEISQKFDQFVAGLMTGLVPALTSVTDKLANLDAAGLGKAFSDYITSAAKAVSNSYLLGDAIDNVKTAIDAIISGNYSEGLSLMWVTMKITALNAVNEIVRNFVAGIQTISQFVSTMFSSSGALVLLMQNAFSTAANYLKEALYTALADFMTAIGRMGMADRFRMEAETARAVVERNLFSIGSQIEEVGIQAAEAGKALPKSFADNKAALDPLFDLTDEFAEQKALQESITKSIVSAQSPAEAIVAAAENFSAALAGVPDTMQSAVNLSGDLFTNLNNAALGAQNVGAAFELGAQSSGQIKMDLESTSESANQTTDWLKEANYQTSQMSLNGSNFAASAAVAASNIAGAKVDARITADVFTGMSDRMNTGANAVNAAIDKLREAHHFGKQTMDEVYQKARDSGQSIIEAQKTASEAMRAQEKATSEMRSAEGKVHNAERAKQNAADRADRMEAAGQTRAAHELRMRAEAEFAKKMEVLGPDVQRAAEAAARALREAGLSLDINSESLDEGGTSAENAMTSGGEAAANALKEAIVPSEKAEAALENIYKFLKDTFFKDFQKRLPQNALS